VRRVPFPAPRLLNRVRRVICLRARCVGLSDACAQTEARREHRRKKLEGPWPQARKFSRVRASGPSIVPANAPRRRPRVRGIINIRDECRHCERWPLDSGWRCERQCSCGTWDREKRIHYPNTTCKAKRQLPAQHFDVKKKIYRSHRCNVQKMRVCGPRLWLRCVLAMGLLPFALPAVSPGASMRPAARASRRHLGLRGGSEDVAEQRAEQGALLPARVRASLLAGAEDTYSHETALEPRDGMIQMTMGQRLIFERSFANARQQGVRVPEAQALAIRSAAEGRVIEPDASMVGSTSIMCLACQLEVADRAQLRAHFATDFHAFNLERKRAGVAPLPQHQFEQRAASLLQEEAQREGATVQQETQNEAHRALRQASRRSAKLAADIEKLLSAKNRDEAALEKARMLLDKKAICDKVSVPPARSMVPHHTNTICARERRSLRRWRSAPEPITLGCFGSALWRLF
jgi:hypothetical protein